MVAKDSEADRVGVGLYSVPEAARLAGIPTQKFRRWLDPLKGLVPNTPFRKEQTLTFLELMELHFIKMFRDHGVSLQTIRRAAKVAAQTFATSHPFAVHRFDTDGRTIFATLADSEKDQILVEDLRHGQYVFDTIIRPFFKKLEYDQDDPVRFWPLSTTGRVVLDPERRFGKPIDAPTGVPTSTLFRAIEAGEEVPCVAAWFDVPIEAVFAAVEFERSLTM